MSGGLLHNMGVLGFLGALLVCGHVLGDFLFQPTSLAVRKRTHPGWVWLHALMVTLVHSVVLIPLLSPLGLLAVWAIWISHGLIDQFKIMVEKRCSRPLLCFTLDQGLHVLVLAGAWGIWSNALIEGAAYSRPYLYYPNEFIAATTTVAVLVTAYVFCIIGGDRVVAGILASYDLEKTPPGKDTKVDSREAPQEELVIGRAIGVIERLIFLSLILVNQWEALGLVVAAKSIAATRAPKRHRFSEYYLIGTLASLLVATATGLLVKALV